MLKDKPLPFKLAVLAACAAVAIGIFVFTSRSTDEVQNSTETAKAVERPKKPEHVRGIHLTSWVAGSKKARARIQDLLDTTELNTVVIAVKEYQGDVYIPGVPLAHKNGAFVNAIPDIREYVAELKKKGVFTVARVVVFKDKKMALKYPQMAVKRPDGSVWTDRAGNAWLDPYNKEAWEYNLAVATRAIELGFEEVQFDYIRFPSDGDMKSTRYSVTQHNSSSAARALDGFLELAGKRLKPLGAYVSIDVFGLTPSVPHDMGIGQKFVQMTQWVDYVSPMVYPSHYAPGEYGIKNPNATPYRVVYRTMLDATNKLGEHAQRLRPYLQDFSLGHRYGPQEVRAQIQACEDLGIKEWLLWSPTCQYQKSALRTKSGELPAAARVPKEWMDIKEKMPAKAAAPAKEAPKANEAPAAEPATAQ